MRIQHNIAALNAYRQLGGNNNAVSKNLEKLSSGYKINRAGDDAAGLAISEKMRAQIKGLDTASKNAQDGVSLIQTAEGALTEVHSMLNRMVELSTQSANGTYGVEERTKINNEVSALKDEIDRISEGTNFNGINLLDGSLGKTSSAADPNAKQFVTPVVKGTGVDTIGFSSAVAQKNVYQLPATTTTDAATDALSISFTGKDGSTKTLTFAETDATALTEAGMGAILAGVLSGANTPESQDLMFSGSSTDLQEFRELFSVTGTANGLEIEVKDSSSKAAIGDLKFGSGATIAAATADLTTAAPFAPDIAASVKKESAGFGIKLNGTLNNIVDGDTITIGGKTYEFDDGTTAGVGSGNIGITKGADSEETTKNLLEALKKDGIEVHIDANDPERLVITDYSKLQTSQKGSKFVSASSGVEITQKDAVKNSTTLKLAGTTSLADLKLQFNYVDEDGNTQTKSLDYKSSANTVAGNADAIKNAIDNDTELKKLFDVTIVGDDITFTAKTGGTDGAKFTGMTSSDPALTMHASTTQGTNAGKDIQFNEDLAVGDTITVDGKTYEFVNDADSKASSGNIAVVRDASINGTMLNFSKQLEKDGVTNTFAGGKITVYDRDSKVSGGLQLQVGDTDDDFQKVSVTVENMGSKSLGLDGVNVSNQITAGKSIDIIKKAIEKVSTARGDLGALQNRLDHTINNLGVTTENMTAAESRIRDVDMASEMMNFTKNNILAQAAQSMLAQANQLPQGVLQLLQ